VPVALDDLLPTTARSPEPPPPADEPPDPGSSAAALPITPSDIDELQRLHDEVTRASDACEGSPFGAKHRKALRAALRAEEDALRRHGFSSYAMFVHAARGDAARPPRNREIWGPTDAAPRPDPPADADTQSELEDARAELAQVRTELAEAVAARRAGEAEREQLQASLADLTKAEQDARAGTDVVGQELIDARDELERLRAAVQDHDRLAAELQEMRDAAEHAAEHAADADRSRDAAVDEIARSRDEIERMRAELAAAHVDAERVGVELAAAHVDAERVGVELAAAHADAERERTEHQAARETVDRLGAELDATQQNLQATQHALETARHDVEAAHIDLAQALADLEQAQADLEQAQAELGDARAEIVTLQDRIQALEAQPAPAPVEPAPEAELQRLTALAQELADARAESAAGKESGPFALGMEDGDAATTAELAGLDERVERLRKKRRRLERRFDQDRTRLRAERSALEHELDHTANELHLRRQQVWDAEAQRDRVLREAEALAARIASDAAATQAENIRQRQDLEELRRAVRASVERAGSELAAVEAAVDTVTVDANALRAKLISMRAELLGASITEPATPGPDAGP
jgi:DNA repair exonuclease SbcCD ATPase subunit